MFWLLQLGMVALVLVNISAVSQVGGDCATQYIDAGNAAACQAGAAIGGGIIAVGGWFLWFLGTIILGILMFATRGKRVTCEVTA